MPNVSKSRSKLCDLPELIRIGLHKEQITFDVHAEQILTDMTSVQYVSVSPDSLTDITMADTMKWLVMSDLMMSIMAGVRRFLKDVLNWKEKQFLKGKNNIII